MLSKLESVLPTVSTIQGCSSTEPAAIFGSGRRLFDNLLFMTADIPAKYKKEQLVRFVESGGNLVWAFDGRMGTLGKDTVEIAKLFGRVLEAKPEAVKDYFSNNGSTESVLANVRNQVVLPSTPRGLYLGGLSHRLDRTNPLVFPILSAAPTASKSNKLVGDENLLISGLSSRSGSRVLFSTTNDLFLDESFNERLVRDLTSWAFGQRAKLQVASFAYNLDARTDAEVPRIRDTFDVELCVKVSDAKGELVPFTPDEEIQAELVMMNPVIRATLHPSANECLSSGPLQLPARYGSYSLHLRYQRHGYNPLVLQEPMTVYPYRYSQTPRFAPVLWPYFAGWFTNLIGTFFVLLPVLLFSRHRRSTGKARA
jgi:oligosaccharyltransferase complex subunit beta